MPCKSTIYKAFVLNLYQSTYSFTLLNLKANVTYFNTNFTLINELHES